MVTWYNVLMTTTTTSLDQFLRTQASLDPFADAKPAEAGTASAAPAQATDKQIAFLKRLMLERPAYCAERGRRVEDLDAAPVSKRQASLWIDALLAVPKEAVAKTEGAPAAAALREGIYKKDGAFYKVYFTRQSRQLVAGKLHVTLGDGGEFLTADWEYLGKAGLRLLTAEDKCSHEEAAAFGHMYGICCNCLAELNDPISVHHGYGPVCADKNDWPRLTAREYARLLAEQGVQA